ncbi:hypothetical protein D3Z62_28490 [Lachnospiraceae bacterium]|nr:hypothetical protein [Lachnospiraceae bacterium]
MNNVRLIISSRYDFRYDYGLMHQFKQLSIQQLSKANIEKYLNSCKVEKKHINPALLELLGFPLLISLYAQTEKYYVNAKKMSFIEWYDKVDNAGKIIWNYMQCQILKPLADFENKKIFYLTVCTNYIIPYISWYMISQNIFFLTEEQFILKLNEAINYFKNRWSKKKPLLIEKIELLYIRKKILWDSKYYYRLILNYMHIFNRSVEGEYSLIHHRFRDCFGAIFLINEINFFNWKILPFQFKDIINEDVLDFIIDLTEKDKVIKIWSNYRNKILEDGSCELKNLYYILYKKCKDEITFENMDLRNVSLCLEQINKRNLCFDGAVLSYDTIVSEEMDSSILCMCVLKKRGICIGGLSDYTVRIWGINYGTFMYVLKGHKGKVTSIAYSPNEKMCLSGSEDCSLILWDIDKGESRFVLTGHESTIVKIEFINNMIVESFSSDGIIRTWNIEKGICLSITQYNELKVGKNKEPNIALLENGNILLNNGMNLIGHKKKVIDYEILPGKNILLSLSLDKSIKVWDTLNGKCQCTLTGFSEWENVIDISFEKKICISGAYDETIRLWDMETGQCKKTMRGHTGFISSLRLTHDATKCISGSYDNTAKIWDLATGECLYTLTGHTQYVRKVECTKDNKFCITASYDGLLKIWEVDTGYLINTLYGHTEGVRAFSLSSDDKYCLSGARDFTAKLWSMESGECIYTFGKHLGHVRSVKIEGEICLTSCTDKKIRKWNIKNGELINTYDLSDISMPNPNIAFCYKEDCVIYFNDGKMIIYNYIENRVIEEIDYIREENHNISDMENIILSPDDKYCVSGSYNSHVVIYNLKEKEYIMKLRAIPYIDIVGTSFYNTCFENEELKNFIFMSGGKV